MTIETYQLMLGDLERFVENLGPRFCASWDLVLWSPADCFQPSNTET